MARPGHTVRGRRAHDAFLPSMRPAQLCARRLPMPDDPAGGQRGGGRRAGARDRQGRIDIRAWPRGPARGTLQNDGM